MTERTIRTSTDIAAYLCDMVPGDVALLERRVLDLALEVGREGWSGEPAHGQWRLTSQTKLRLGECGEGRGMGYRYCWKRCCGSEGVNVAAL